MKKLILTVICFLAIASFAWAGTNVIFQWNPNTEADLAGYNLYRSNVIGTYLDTPDVVVECGPNDASCCTATESNIPDGIWFWVVKAFDSSGNVSVINSNEVTRKLDSTAPGTVDGLTIKAVIKIEIE